MKKLLTMALLMIACSISFAQTKVSGVVTDAKDGSPIPFASVVVKGTTTGTATDADGKYVLSVPSNQSTLIFSNIGYLAQEVEIGGRNTINIILKEDTEMLDETIVVAYGTVKKSSYTGSASVVGEDVMLERPYSSFTEALKRVEQITGKKVKFYEVDLLDRDKLDEVFSQESIEYVIHFAGYKAVGESVQKPLEYYYNNITGTLILCDLMRKHGCKNIVFSSSATVYGDPAFIPITEECPLGDVTNPYGRTKKMLEEILKDLYVSDNEWNIILLRYFNPIGAHESGLIGENPKGIPNNLMPYVTQVAIGKLERLGVFGNDYDTEDGTGVRDYIHVVDLAYGHVKALEKISDMESHGETGVKIYNLGVGKGVSVLEVIRNFEDTTGAKVPYEIKPRRAGDIATCYADASKAERELGWKAKYDFKKMCEDSWRWQSKNPNGYEM